jgi:glycosyltransferase involved in cell wall biosynthesis
LQVSSRSEISQNTLAVVIRAFDGGGAQRDMVLLCNALAARGVRPTVLTLSGKGPLRALLDPAIRVIEVPGRKLRYAVPALHWAIRALAPALVVSSEANLNLCVLIAVRSLSRQNRPKLVLREVGSPSIAQYRDPYRQNRIAYRMLRRFYRHADRIITLTDGARRDLADNFAVPEQMIAVMRTNAVIPAAMAKQLACWDGEVGRERDLIVCIGRLSPEKDHYTLLRAMTLLPTHRPWRVALVGEGPQRKRLAAFVDSAGLAERTIFTGHADDPFAWMMRASVAVCSSVYEGLGNAIIEALACGTPVVSTDAPYGPREILQAGRYGTLTPVGDAAAMAAAIKAALDEVPNRRKLMARGLQYTAAAAAERFLEIVADLQFAPSGAKARLAVARAS